ncbi:hypothetical protein RRG08_055035 [Elysia crispata]|uniref:Uncharacterized protein n=1 Tax=Elysia crispata TaxID=231223 RepID=A0AAE0XS10_9GAST|nr:hypothetical protein RRG08_055035 [Elysia crispata]
MDHWSPDGEINRAAHGSLVPRWGDKPCSSWITGPYMERVRAPTLAGGEVLIAGALNIRYKLPEQASLNLKCDILPAKQKHGPSLTRVLNLGGLSHHLQTSASDFDRQSGESVTELRGWPEPCILLALLGLERIVATTLSLRSGQSAVSFQPLGLLRKTSNLTSSFKSILDPASCEITAGNKIYTRILRIIVASDRASRPAGLDSVRDSNRQIVPSQWFRAGGQNPVSKRQVKSEMRRVLSSCCSGQISHNTLHYLQYEWLKGSSQLQGRRPDQLVISSLCGYSMRFSDVPMIRGRRWRIKGRSCTAPIRAAQETVMLKDWVCACESVSE